MFNTYHVKEHLVISSNASENVITLIMRKRISLLVAKMLMNEAEFEFLGLTVDNHSYNFDGCETTPILSHQMDALPNASSLDLTMCYMYTDRNDELSEMASPINTVEIFEDFSKEDKSLLDGIFYSAYIHDDSCCNHVGTLYAYGRKKGTYYHGIVNFVPIPHQSIGGLWSNTSVVLSYHSDELSRKDISQIKAVYEEMCSLPYACDHTFSATDHQISCLIETPVFTCGDDLKRFLDLGGDLIRLSGCKSAICAEFYDFDVDDVHLVKAEYNDDGSYTLFEAII